MLSSDPFNVFGTLLLVSLVFWILDDTASKQFIVKSIAPVVSMVQERKRNQIF